MFHHSQLKGTATTCLRLTARVSLGLAAMLAASAQIKDIVGIVASPAGEIAVANHPAAVVVDGYGLPRRFEYAAVTGATDQWVSEHLLECGPIYVDSFDLWNVSGAFWSFRVVIHHWLLLTTCLCLNILVDQLSSRQRGIVATPTA
jgi:hypothetical protein